MTRSKGRKHMHRGGLVFIILASLAALIVALLVYRPNVGSSTDITTWKRQSIIGLGISAKLPEGTIGNKSVNTSQPAVASLELDADYRLELRDISGSTSGQLEVDRVATVSIGGVTRYVLARNVGERGKTSAIYLSDCAQSNCGVTNPNTGKLMEVTLWKETQDNPGSSNPAEYFLVDEPGAREGIEVLKSVQFE